MKCVIAKLSGQIIDNIFIFKIIEGMFWLYVE